MTVDAFVLDLIAAAARRDRALVAVAEAARECVSPCRVISGWCLNHHDSEPCAHEVLADALVALSGLEEG